MCELSQGTIGLQLLDLTVNLFFLKLFQISNILTVKMCQKYFCCDLPM